MPTGQELEDHSSIISATPTQNFTTPAYAIYDHLGMTLVCISGGGEFDTIRGWCDNVTQVILFISVIYAIFQVYGQRLEKEGTLDAIATASGSGQTEYSVADLGIPGLRHFIYKSRSHIQITVPMFEDPYDAIEDKRR